MTRENVENKGKKRNSEATYQSILEAAKVCFTRSGYDGVGVREIAKRAGVDPALIVRYFGSKEELFVVALREISGEVDFEAIFSGDTETIGERFADCLLLQQTQKSLQFYLRSLGSTAIVPMLSRIIKETLVATIAANLEGDQASLKAEAIATFILGISVNYCLSGMQMFKDEDRENFRSSIAKMIQSCIQ
jgi:AcrR family transcriptional regulator